MKKQSPHAYDENKRLIIGITLYTMVGGVRKVKVPKGNLEEQRKKHEPGLLKHWQEDRLELAEKS